MNKIQKIELLPLTDDYVFKRVFTKDGQEDMLKDLLSAILNIEIKKIEIKNPEMTKQSKEAKREILDIRATINDNSLIDIEMQVRDYKNIDKRSIAYLTKLYSEQLQTGDDYNKPKKTISINILNFNFFRRNTYHSIGRLKFENIEKEKYVEVGESEEDVYVTKDLEVHYIELPKFVMKNPGVKTKLEQWLWLICGKEEKAEMAKKENKEVEKASKVLETMSMSYEERWLYDARKFREWDERSLREYITKEAREEGLEKGREEGLEKGREEGLEKGREEGLEKGREEGLEKGREEGLEKGREEGLEKGRKEGILETARNMFKKGIDIKIISEATGLSEKEITGNN